VIEPNGVWNEASGSEVDAERRYIPSSLKSRPRNIPLSMKKVIENAIEIGKIKKSD
jgi:hypothetical protein